MPTLEDGGQQLGGAGRLSSLRAPSVRLLLLTSEADYAASAAGFA